ncbi:MAG: RNA 2',3'-cyclic phosphodiesterase, partial [Verrucomicrobia bacterium]
MKPKRLFVAISPPPVIQQSLVDLDPGIRGVRWTERNQMHLTLGFFPDVSEHVDRALRENLNAIEFRAFFLPLQGIGTFPSKGPPKIIWIGVGKGHPHLFQL